MCKDDEEGIQYVGGVVNYYCVGWVDTRALPYYAQPDDMFYSDDDWDDNDV
jgi:hypothetical protein